MSYYNHFLNSSIGRKQLVAATGLVLIVYVVLHLAGNLLIYAGPAVFNGYAKTLSGFRPWLYAIEFGLLLIFVTHMYFTALVVLDNMRARGQQSYAVYRSVGERSLATRLMPYTGTVILAFVIWHIFDFTLVDHYGVRSILPDGQSYGLYGVVYNSFRDPLHSSLYICAVICVGMHLYHGVESFMQTFGFNSLSFAPKARFFSQSFSILITLGYCSIPIFVMIDSHRFTAW